MNTTKENVLQTLNKYGVAIIPGLLTPEECENAKKGMWDTLEYISERWRVPIRRTNQGTWKETHNLCPHRGMLLHHFQLGHSQFVWDIRQNEKVVDIFSEIWRTKKEDMLVSFDGLSISLPPEVTGFGWREKENTGEMGGEMEGEMGEKSEGTWFHTDQSYLRNGFECVQGLVTPYEVREGDATFTYLENSHKYHSLFRQEFDVQTPFNYYQLTPEELSFYKQHMNCKERKVVCPAGSLILWDSRLIHCGINASRTRERQNIRCAVYVCYYPRAASKRRYISKKIYAFENMLMTNHYAYKANLFPIYPPGYNPEIEMNMLPEPRLTQLGRRLVGYEN